MLPGGMGTPLGLGMPANAEGIVGMEVPKGKLPGMGMLMGMPPPPICALLLLLLPLTVMGMLLPMAREPMGILTMPLGSPLDMGTVPIGMLLAFMGMLLLPIGMEE